MFELETPLEKVKHIGHIPGWCDGKIMRRLQQLARGRQVVVNVGAWKGRSCAALAQGAGVVYAIDHWRGSPQEVDGTVSYDHKQAGDNPLSVLWEFCQYMRHFDLLGTKVIPITGDSPNVATLFKAASVDVVFIDGAHDYGAVWRDLEAWAGRVKKGGILCGDDYRWPGVKQATNQFWLMYECIHGLGELEVDIDGKFWLMRRGI